ncbi:hypothetical protein ACFLW9_01440 [Chloroflexota bacterium]
MIEEGIHKKTDDDGEEHDVIIQTIDDNGEEVKIATKYLRDYLAARKAILIRQHDHRRSSKDKVDSLGLNSTVEYENKIPQSHHYKVLVRNERLLSGKECFSRLLGKDIVKPFEKPYTSHLWFDEEHWKNKKYEKFIFTVDENGNNIEETSNENELSNYFVDRGKPHYLTPIYFRREVLKKYYDNPKKYSVDTLYLRCLHLWGIPLTLIKRI